MSARAVGLVSHPDRPQAAELGAQVRTALSEHGIEVRTPDPSRASTFAEGLDVVISLGGDGTMLRAVDLAYEVGVPVLGVQPGLFAVLNRGAALEISATGLNGMPPTVAIAGLPAQVVYFGQPQFPGLDQVNVLVPAGVPADRNRSRSRLTAY